MEAAAARPRPVTGPTTGCSTRRVAAAVIILDHLGPERRSGKQCRRSDHHQVTASLGDRQGIPMRRSLLRLTLAKAPGQRTSTKHVCTTWGVRGKDLYLLNLLRRRLEYPALKRAVREQQ